MNNVDARLIRGEIDELLRSKRLKRLETVSAHIFEMFNQEWKESTSREVLVHIFHDSDDDVHKILARDRFKLIFNYVPLSASFTFTCLSRKFVRLIINKFNSTATAYGFGFSVHREMDTFCAQLSRIHSYARKALVPSLKSATLGLSKIEIQSPSSTPSRTSLLHGNMDSCQDEYHDILDSPAYTSLSVTSFNHVPSPYRQPLLTCDDMLSLSTYNQTTEFLHSTPSIERFDFSYGDSVYHNFSFTNQNTSLPMCEAPDLSRLPFPDLSLLVAPFSLEKSLEWSSLTMSSSSYSAPVVTPEPSRVEWCKSDLTPQDKLVAVERRLRALMDSIQPVNVTDDIFNNPDDANPSPPSASRPENPAGVIGTPVNGRGGASVSRHQSPEKSWQWH